MISDQMPNYFSIDTQIKELSSGIHNQRFDLIQLLLFDSVVEGPVHELLLNLGRYAIFYYNFFITLKSIKYSPNDVLFLLSEIKGFLIILIKLLKLN